MFYDEPMTSLSASLSLPYSSRDEMLVMCVFGIYKDLEVKFIQLYLGI